MLGKTISHYLVLRRLGGGGMGVVYEAEDVRLKRRVALKVLPETMAKDSNSLRRLEREARAASSLNHPNICTIHEIEDNNGQPVIVMELLDGSTLKERLEDGPLSISELLRLGIDICEALDSAHSRRIIHRDIKPANIFVTSRGSAKLLDFGLAKLLSVQPKSDTDLGESELTLTEAGVIPGTTAYMSPEQVRGEELDSRTDIFSLGAVLYEMATRKRPFVRKNTVLTLDAILNSNPAPVSSLNSALPRELDRILERALEKKPDRRYQTAAELRGDLQQLKHEFDRPDVQARKPSPTARTRWNLHRWKLLLPASIAMIAVAVGAFFYTHRAKALTERDTIVVADFENNTGEAVFDETLKQALSVDLGQSPFLNILSDRKVAATLRLMGRPPDALVTGEVARELCQRVRSKAMLTGSISNLGNEYILGLRAINCSTGDTIVAEQARASGKEQVLKSLDKSASAVRSNLGESLASQQKFSTPLEEATTPSLEALNAYSMGRKAGFFKGDAAAIPYLQQAVELDPNFALAYRALGVSYNNLGQTTRASDSMQRAFDLRGKVSERERYAIETQYYQVVTGELTKATRVYELWRQSYPRDFLVPGNLGDIYMRLGQWDKSRRESEQVEPLEPNSAVFHSNLGFAQLALNKIDDARATVQRAQARKLDTFLLRLVSYDIGFLQRDQQIMQQQLDWAVGRPGEEDWLLWAQSDTEAYFGRIARAREFSQRAIDSAMHADAKEAAALWQVGSAMREAEFGNAALARKGALAALALTPGRDIKCFAAMALARAGDAAQAQKIAEDLDKHNPVHSVVQSYWLPSIRAAIEIDKKNPDKALQFLQNATCCELAQTQPFLVGMMYPVYLRGQAYLFAHDGNQAIAEFKKMVDHPGVLLNCPLGSLAHLGLARAYALQGDTASARREYREFLTLWKDAGPDIPILRGAKEYSKLQ